MPSLRIESQSDISPLVEYLLRDLDDEQMDELEVDREFAPVEVLATEPVTVAAVISGSTALIAALGVVVSRFLEKQRQHDTLAIVLSAYDVSREAGDKLAELAKKYANVSVNIVDSGK